MDIASQHRTKDQHLCFQTSQLLDHSEASSPRTVKDVESFPKNLSGLGNERPTVSRALGNELTDTVLQYSQTPTAKKPHLRGASSTPALLHAVGVRGTRRLSPPPPTTAAGVQGTLTGVQRPERAALTHPLTPPWTRDVTVRSPYSSSAGGRRLPHPRGGVQKIGRNCGSAVLGEGGARHHPPKSSFSSFSRGSKMSCPSRFWSYMEKRRHLPIILP